MDDSTIGGRGFAASETVSIDVGSTFGGTVAETVDFHGIGGEAPSTAGIDFEFDRGTVKHTDTASLAFTDPTLGGDGMYFENASFKGFSNSFAGKAETITMGFNMKNTMEVWGRKRAVSLIVNNLPVMRVWLSKKAGEVDVESIASTDGTSILFHFGPAQMSLSHVIKKYPKAKVLGFTTYQYFPVQNIKDKRFLVNNLIKPLADLTAFHVGLIALHMKPVPNRINDMLGGNLDKPLGNIAYITMEKEVFYPDNLLTVRLDARSMSERKRDDLAHKKQQKLEEAALRRKELQKTLSTTTDNTDMVYKYKQYLFKCARQGKDEAMKKTSKRRKKSNV